MTEDDLMPIARRALGSAIVTGASGASIALAFARPTSNQALHAAYDAALEARKGALAAGREGLRAAKSAGLPSLSPALAVKDRLRERALTNLPPGIAGAVEAWRHQFIEGEKLAYYGTKRLVDSLDPARELAWTRSRSVLAEAVNAFADVAEVALATSVKFGEELQGGDLSPPKRKAPSGARARPRAKKRKSVRARK